MLIWCEFFEAVFLCGHNYDKTIVTKVSSVNYMTRQFLYKIHFSQSKMAHFLCSLILITLIEGFPLLFQWCKHVFTSLGDEIWPLLIIIIISHLNNPYQLSQIGALHDDLIRSHRPGLMRLKPWQLEWVSINIKQVG